VVVYNPVKVLHNVRILNIALVIVIIDRLLILVTDVPSIVFVASVFTILLSVFALLEANIHGRASSIFLFVSASEISNGIVQFIAGTNLSSGYVLYMSAILAFILGGFICILLPTTNPSSNNSVGSGLRFDPNSEYVIELDNVYKDYYVGGIVVHALRGVSLKIRRGEFVAIMGPSGSGKSTLLNMIGALDKPTKGKIYIEGVDISQLNDNQLAELRNKKIGFIFQMFNLITRTSVLRNVELPSIVAGKSKKERIERAKKLLEIMGLDSSVFKRRPVYLSGGQQQRVAIARALMNNPVIILADEPTGNLDSKTGEEVMKYLRMLNKKFNTTVIVVTHDRAVAETADKIFHIRDGKIIREEIVGEKAK